MQTRTVPEITLLLARRSLRLPEAGAFIAEALPGLEADAAANRIAFAGPWMFVSHNLPQDTATRFPLAIGRPVSVTGGYAGAYEIETLPAFPCAWFAYEGPLSGIHAGGYAPLLDAIFAAGARLTGEIREVHHVRDGPESPLNQVEIQIGIADSR